MRVRGQSPILWRCLGQSQVGAEPGHAVVVDGLSYQEQQLLDRLPTSMSPSDVYQVARWSEVPIARARELMSVLDEAGVLTRDASTPASEDEVYWERVSDNPRVRTQALRRGVVGPQRAQVVGFGCCLACHEGDSTILRPARARRWGGRFGSKAAAIGAGCRVLHMGERSPHRPIPSFPVILGFSRIVGFPVMLSHVQSGPLCTWEDSTGVERRGVSA